MSNVSTNQVQGLMEAYTAVYDPDLRDELEEEQLEIEELGLQIIENAAYTLFSLGYDVNDLIDYFSEANEEVIVEDAIAISEGVLLVENVTVSDEYIEEQFEILNERGAALGWMARQAGRAGQAFSNIRRALTPAAKAKPKNYDSPVSRALGASPKPLPTTNQNVIQRGVNWAKSNLGKLPPAAKAAGKFAGKALPGVGAALYGMDAADRFKKGDWGGGLLSGVGAVTSLVPGGFVAGLAPAGIQMATDAMGLTGDKSLKGKGGAKPTPSPGAPKPQGGAGNVNVPGKGPRYYSSSDKKYYKNYNDALAARRSRRGEVAPTSAPGASASAAPSGAGRAPSAPSGGGRTPSAPPVPPAPSGGGRTPSAPPAPAKPEPPKAPSGETPMQQWARANPNLAARVRPGQSGYDEISTTPGPNQKQDQTSTQGTTPSPQQTRNSTEQEKRKKELQGATTASESYDAFDYVLDYLFNEGHVDSLDEALYVMMEMDSETIQNICEGPSVPMPSYYGKGNPAPMPSYIQQTPSTSKKRLNYKPLEELYKGRHGQSEEEHMDSRSDSAKRISGDSKRSGAAYSHRSYRGVGGPARPGERQQHQGRMDANSRAYLEYLRANRKKRSK